MNLLKYFGGPEKNAALGVQVADVGLLKNRSLVSAAALSLVLAGCQSFAGDGGQIGADATVVDADIDGTVGGDGSVNVDGNFADGGIKNDAQLVAETSTDSGLASCNTSGGELTLAPTTASTGGVYRAGNFLPSPDSFEREAKGCSFTMALNDDVYILIPKKAGTNAILEFDYLGARAFGGTYGALCVPTINPSTATLADVKATLATTYPAASTVRTGNHFTITSSCVDQPAIVHWHAN